MAVDIEQLSIDDAISEFEKFQLDFKDSAAYFNAEQRDFAVGVATPPALRDLQAMVGLPRIYVQSIAERLIIEGFRVGDAAETDETLWSWFRANSMDTQSMVSFVDSLVYGRSYVTIAAPAEADKDNPLMVQGVPIIRVESPMALFAHKDPRTEDIEWAVRVIKDEDQQVVGATLYFRDRTELYEGTGGRLDLVDTVHHGLGVVPVVDVTRRSSLLDRYGTSIISPEIRSITDAMSRLLQNLQVTSELMATPQRILFGTSVEEINERQLTGLELYTASYIAVEDPTGKAIQLPAAELRNFTEAISHMLRLAAAYTGLPPQYLSFTTDNPASAEAIRSSETRLVRTCEALAAVFGDAWEKVMRIAMLVMGQKLTLDSFRIETVWRDPSTPTFQAKADATTKLYNSGNGIISKEQARIDMGYTPEQRRQMEEWDRQTPSAQMAAMYAPPMLKEVDDGSADAGGEAGG